MNIIEITEKFPTELDAVKYFEKIRWGKQPKCPYCNSTQLGARNKDFRFHCKACQKSFSVTTEYKGYSRMHNIIEHLKIDHTKIYSYRRVNTNTIESFWAVVERGIMGQFHQVSPKYLPTYIAEFVFKYNNRNKEQNGKKY